MRPIPSLLTVVCVVAGAFAVATNAYAASITVDSLGDDILTAANDGDCTLREAIDAANTNSAEDECPAGSPGPDTIILPAGTIMLSVLGSDEDADLDGDLDIGESVTITGGGTRITAVDGNRTVTGEGVFDIPAVGATVTIQDLTVRNGAGGILVQQMTTTLNLLRAAVNENEGGAGAGVNNFGILNLTDVSLAGNTSSGGGGALRISGPTTLANVTLSGNTAVTDGGAIYVDESLTMNNVTITDNVADSDADGSGNGGGIYRAAMTTTLRNSIIAQNQDKSAGGDPKHPDCSGTVTSAGYNLMGDTAGCTLSGDPTGNLVGQNPQISGLADNGGPTDTHALKPNSPALDAANPALAGSGGSACEAADQRGLPRTGSRCDIGAYELVQCLGVDVTVIGTDGPDTLTGTSKADGILALGGNDVVTGGGGKDAVCAGPGDDTVRGGDADDEVIGEAGNDVLGGDPGNDTLSGQQGNDRLTGAGGNDLLRGQGGRDRLKGKGGDDTLKGGAKPDNLDGGGGIDTCRGGGGRDRIRRCE